MMEFIIAIILQILKAFIPAIMEKMQDTAEIGEGITDEDRKLREKIRADGWDLST